MSRKATTKASRPANPIFPSDASPRLPHMTQRRYKEYAQSPKGKAARARAHARYVAKRRERSSRPTPINAAPLVQAITQWKAS